MLFCYFMLCIRWTGPLEQKLWHCALLIATTQKICPSLVVKFSPSHPQRYSPNYRQTSNISRTLVGNKIVDHSDVVGASPVGAASTTSLFSTYHLASMDWTKTTAKRDEKHLNFVICAPYIRGSTVCIIKWPIIGSDDGLLPVRTKLSYRPILMHFQLGQIQWSLNQNSKFVFLKSAFQMLSAKCPPFPPCLNMSTDVLTCHIRKNFFSEKSCFANKELLHIMWCATDQIVSIEHVIEARNVLQFITELNNFSCHFDLGSHITICVKAFSYDL